MMPTKAEKIILPMATFKEIIGGPSREAAASVVIKLIHTISKAKSNQPTNDGQDHRLNQKLNQNLTRVAPQCLAKANFSRPLSDRNQHDIHDSIPPTKREIPAIAPITDVIIPTTLLVSSRMLSKLKI